MTMKLFVLLILAVFASENAENGPENGEKIGNNENNLIFVKIEESEYAKVNKKSKYIGLTYHKDKSKWRVRRWSKKENKNLYNGYYDDEDLAAHASDTLARELMNNGEQGLKLNFPEDHIKIHPEKSSKYIGVSYNKNNSKWSAQRWRKNENKKYYNGYYDDAETAAHASDTLARILMEKDVQNLKLNFPDDYTEIYPEEKSSKFIGVSYITDESKWYVQRWSKNKSKLIYNGRYDDEKTAAHGSDTLARKLMDNGEQGHKLNFPEDHTKVFPEENQNKKRKRSEELDSGHPQNN